MDLDDIKKSQENLIRISHEKFQRLLQNEQAIREELSEPFWDEEED